MQDVGVKVDVSVKTAKAPEPRPLDETGFRDFAVAGTRVSGEFRCGDCGYGAVVHRALPPCPMCGGSLWESRPPRFES